MNLSLIKKLCVVKKIELYNVLFKYLKKYGYKNIIAKPKYIMAEGDLPICLIAHMDTVFSQPQKKENFIYDQEQKILWGMGGSGFDDRAGIYAIIELLERGLRPHVIFTDGEGNPPYRVINSAKNGHGTVLWILDSRLSFEKSRYWIEKLPGSSVTYLPF